MKEINDCLKLRRKSQQKGEENFKEKQFRRIMEAKWRRTSSRKPKNYLYLTRVREFESCKTSQGSP